MVRSGRFFSRFEVLRTSTSLMGFSTNQTPRPFGRELARHGWLGWILIYDLCLHSKASGETASTCPPSSPAPGRVEPSPQESLNGSGDSGWPPGNRAAARNRRLEVLLERSFPWLATSAGLGNIPVESRLGRPRLYTPAFPDSICGSTGRRETICPTVTLTDIRGSAKVGGSNFRGDRG